MTTLRDMRRAIFVADVARRDGRLSADQYRQLCEALHTHPAMDPKTAASTAARANNWQLWPTP